MTEKETLRKCEVFSGLTDSQLQKVVNLVVEKRYDAGTNIFQEGDAAEELHVIEEGRVALQMALPKAEGQMSRRVTIDIVTRNEVMGWATVVEPYKYAFTAVCLQEVKALSINGSKLRWLLRDDPKIGYEILKGLMKVVASRLHDTTQVLASERSLAA